MAPALRPSREPNVKKTRLILVLLSAVAMGVGLSACPGPKEDDTGAGANTNCQIVWANQGSVTARFDIYLVDMPIADWVDGTIEYSKPDDRVAIFYNELLVSSNAYYSRAITTAGTFSITATQGTNIGEPVTLADDGNQLYFDLGADESSGVQVGDGGLANFSSTWSASGALDPDPAARVTMTYMTSAMQLGLYTNYAICYRATSTFAPESPVSRASRVLREHFPQP